MCSVRSIEIKLARVCESGSAVAVHGPLDEAVGKVGATEQADLAQQIRPTLRQPSLDLSGKAAEHLEGACYLRCLPTEPPAAQRATMSAMRATSWTAPSRARLARIRARLREIYGVPAAVPHRRPLDELILTVLSQSTNDRNAMSPSSLYASASRAGGVRDAPLADVELAIRPEASRR